MGPFRIDFRSLPAQMILSFIALVLLTAAATGLPAIWLIRDQLERQAWTQVEHGSRAAQALYAAQQNEITSLATLTAQRPTLRDLLVRGDFASMQSYLGTLQTGAGLDLVLICGPGGQVTAQTDAAFADVLCKARVPAGFHVVSAEGASEVWLFAAHPVGDSTTGPQGDVIVGKRLDDEFARQMRTQTGLEQALLVDDQAIAASLDTNLLAPRLEPSATDGDIKRGTFAVDAVPYYAIRFPLSPPTGETTEEGTPVTGAQPQIDAQVALEVADIVAAQRGLAWTLIASIVIVTIVGSFIGAFRARQISRPLAHLTDRAIALSQGHLDSPVAVEAQVREVALVAQALDKARIDLKRTLTELQKEKDWTDHLLEAFVEGIVTVDHQGRVTFFSRGAERITGWDREQVLNRPCDEILRPVETDKPFSQLLPTPGRRHKITVELADGRHATLAVTGAQLIPPEAGEAEVALVFRDISEEEAVHRLMGHFLANVAHEFRTPLSALAASTELLLDQAPDLNADELQELLTSLHLGILGLETLVDNLLESASIEIGHFRVNPRPANVGRIISEAIGTMQPLLEKHGQRLVVELPVTMPLVKADSRRTIQVLVNLLSNASRYGPDNAEITVGATVSEHWVQVTVADQGPGIPPEYRKDLFRRFAYPDMGGNRTKYGVGLGLSVVKAVIEAQGGQVGVRDCPGGGAIFWFTLPAEEER